MTGTYSGGSAEPITDMMTEKQAIDIAYMPARRSKFNPLPLIIAVSAFVMFYLIVALLGIIVAATVSRNHVKLAIAINENVNKAIACYGCIPSDEDWNDCKTFCTDKGESTSLSRIRKILHRSESHSCDGIQLEQNLTCIDGADINELPWTEWSMPAATGKRYRIRAFPTLAIYRNIKGNSEKSSLDESQRVEASNTTAVN
uniref:Thioredoxin domain-containing protein n=1 Tax=Panagrellus redivivus TaxID=6233 RepID=A0A7E4VLV1_PANRE